MSAAILPTSDGGSHIHITWNRTPTSFGGRVAAFMIKATKGKPVGASIERDVGRGKRQRPLIE